MPGSLPRLWLPQCSGALTCSSAELSPSQRLFQSWERQGPSWGMMLDHRVRNWDLHQGWPKEALDRGSPCPKILQLMDKSAKAWLEQEADPQPRP